MATVTIEEAQSRLAELIANLQAGEEVVITRNESPVAKLVPAASASPPKRQPGLLKDKILYMAEDFDAPLEDFREYMP